MSMAARAVNSRAVSSISLEGIGDIYPEAVARGRGGRRGREGGRVTRSRQVERSQQPPGLGTPDRIAEGQRIVVRDPPPAPAGRPAPALPLALLLVASQLVLDRVHQRLPRRLDDIVGHPHRPPGLVAVARGDEDAGLGRGGLRFVEDPHLVVQQRHLAQIRVEVLEGLAEGVVERVHGAVARRRGVLLDALHAQAHGGLRHRLAVARVLLDDHAIALQLEVRPVVAEGPLHQELEGGLRALEQEALVLEPLEHLEDAAGLRGVLVEIDAVLLGLPEHVGLPGQLGDEHPALVAHRPRVHVLVGLGMLEHRGDVDAALVGERGVAHVGLGRPRLAVGQLGHEAGDVAQLAQVLGRDALEPHLQHEIGDDRDEVGVAAALAVTVDRPLHVADALTHRGQRGRHRALGIVVHVDAERGLRLHRALDLLDDGGDLVRQAPPVGVAEHEAVGPRGLRGAQRPHRVLRVALEAVEEVLGVVDDLLEVLEEVRDRIRDHGHVLLERGAERRGHVEVPRLAEDGDDGRPRLDEGLEVAVLLRPHAGPAGGAEGADLRALEHRVLHALEEAQVLGIRPGPAALDVVHAELVEAVRDTHLVLHGEGHALALGAVAERGVVDLDLARHGGHIIPPPPGGCQVMLGGVIAALMAMVVLVAAFVKGAIGFGFPALGTPLLSLVVDVKTAVVVLILPNIVMDGIQFARRGTLLSTVRRFWVLLAAGAVGVVLGTRAGPPVTPGRDADPGRLRALLCRAERDRAGPARARALGALALGARRLRGRRHRRGDQCARRRARPLLPGHRAVEARLRVLGGLHVLLLQAGPARRGELVRAPALVAGLAVARPDRGGPGRLRGGTARAGPAGSAWIQPRGAGLPRAAGRVAADPQPLVRSPRPRGARYTTPVARSLSTRAFGMRRSPVRIASVCWPSSGGASVAAPGVSCRRTGTPMTVIGPAFGWDSETIMPRALRCALSHTSATDLMRPAGTPALSRRASHSSAGRAPRISLRSGTRTLRLVTRLASVSKRGSLMRSSRSSARHVRSHSELLATPSVM